MCSPSNSALIDNVIREWTGQNRAFTAFEVSLEAKSRGATERHRDMRAYIHQTQALVDQMEFGDYQQTLIPVGSEKGQTLQAFLYHPKSYDVSRYQPLSRKGQAPQQVTPPASIPTPAIAATSPSTTPSLSAVLDGDDDHDTGDDAFHLDYRKRLLVPTKYLREAGFKQGDNVCVLADSVCHSILIVKDEPSTANFTVKVQRVEKDGDLRLSQTTLQGAGLNGDKFSIDIGDQVGPDPNWKQRAVLVTAAPGQTPDQTAT